MEYLLITSCAVFLIGIIGPFVWWRVTKDKDKPNELFTQPYILPRQIAPNLHYDDFIAPYLNELSQTKTSAEGIAVYRKYREILIDNDVLEYGFNTPYTYIYMRLSMRNYN